MAAKINSLLFKFICFREELGSGHTKKLPESGTPQIAKNRSDALNLKTQAQQEERERISADMHDELGFGMTAIRLMSEIARNKMKENTPVEIEKISFPADDVLKFMSYQRSLLFISYHCR